MATPYVMPKLSPGYYQGEAGPDLPECCQEPGKARFSYTSWCPVCSPSGQHGASTRRRSQSESLEATDPLRDHNRGHGLRLSKDYDAYRQYEREYGYDPDLEGSPGATASLSERILPLMDELEARSLQLGSYRGQDCWPESRRRTPARSPVAENGPLPPAAGPADLRPPPCCVPGMGAATGAAVAAKLRGCSEVAAAPCCCAPHRPSRKTHSPENKSPSPSASPPRELGAQPARRCPGVAAACDRRGCFWSAGAAPGPGPGSVPAAADLLKSYPSAPCVGQRRGGAVGGKRRSSSRSPLAHKSPPREQGRSEKHGRPSSKRPSQLNPLTDRGRQEGPAWSSEACADFARRDPGGGGCRRESGRPAGAAKPKQPPPGSGQYSSEVEALRSRLRELRGGQAEGKRLRQRSEPDPGGQYLASPAASLAVSLAAAAAAAPPPPPPQPLHCAEASVGGACGPKRARDASPPPLPPCDAPESTARSPSRPDIVNILHRNLSVVRSLEEESESSEYDDNAPDAGFEGDSKETPAEGSEEEEDDTRSVVSCLTMASSSGSASPSVVGESLGSISLNDVAVAGARVPVAPTEPLRPPLPPVVALSQRRKGSLPPGLRSSLFSHVPPFIHFSTHDIKGDPLPPELAALLKWKLSTITPLVVRRTLLNSGFRLVRKSNDWSGTWGKHMKSLCFRTLKESQKINHFPGTFQIGRKDRLWKNLYRLMIKYGKKEFGFIPRTYVLPQDTKLLRQAWEKNCGKEKWIIKPPASARGSGIKVIHRWTQIPKKRPLVVQKYIADPYLINGSKFDLRLYVLVTSMNPLRVYIYDDGLVRFASVKYSGEMSTLSDRYMHLTNYSINKLSSMYTQNEDATACQGHKWTVKTLWNYMERQGVDVGRLWDTLVDLCIKTVISGESSISQLTRTNLPSRYCSYELFGIDVLLDERLKPWLLEVNISPSLHSASPLDLAVKGPLVRDLMNLAGYHVPNKLPPAQVEELLSRFGLSHEHVSSLCFDRRLYTMILNHEERRKHHLYQAIMDRDEYLCDILKNLSSDDVRHLIQAEDELTQAGRFIRIFPTPSTHLYLEYFESPTYYNRLFDAWETKYHENRQEGIELLESLCRHRVHLSVPSITSTAKSSVNQQVHLVDDELDDMAIELEKTSSEEILESEKRASLSLSTVALYRAARPRSGKMGVVLKPFPRSSYVSRKPRTAAGGSTPSPSTTSSGKTSSATIISSITSDVSSATKPAAPETPSEGLELPITEETSAGPVVVTACPPPACLC